MSIRKKFNKILGLEDNVEAEKKRFAERVNQIIFHTIDTTNTIKFDYIVLFELLCFELGVNALDFPQRRDDSDLFETFFAPASIRTLTKDDFNKTLLVLCILYVYLKKSSDSKSNHEWLSKKIESVMSRCSCDIGIRWKEGFFYPVGVEELDEPLIEETLTWLKDYPNERKDYRKALEYYLEEKSLDDVIKNCYSAVEGVTRKVLGNDKTLDNNKNELLRKMNLSDGWNSMLANYIKYAHHYRHASADRHKITKQETEAYLYMTGLIINLIIKSK